MCPSPRGIVKSPRGTTDCITVFSCIRKFSSLQPPPSALLGLTKVLQCAWNSCSRPVQRFILYLHTAGECVEVRIPEEVRRPPSLGAALLYNHVHGNKTMGAATLISTMVSSNQNTEGIRTMLRRKVATVRKAFAGRMLKDSTEPGRCAFFNQEWTANIKVTKALLSRPDGDSSQLASQPQKRNGRPSSSLLAAPLLSVTPITQLKADKPATALPRQFRDGAVVFVKADTSPGVRGERASSYVGRIVSYMDGTYQVRNVIDGGEGRCRREEERDMQLHRLSNSGMDGILLRSDLHASNTGPRRVEITAAQKKAADAETGVAAAEAKAAAAEAKAAAAKRMSLGHESKAKRVRCSLTQEKKRSQGFKQDAQDLEQDLNALQKGATVCTR